MSYLRAAARICAASMWWLIAACLVATVGLGPGLGQEAGSAPPFEVASVKASAGPPARGTRGQRGTGDPTRLALPYQTLRSLILSAYDLNPWQLSGGAAWIDLDRFDIEARCAKPSTREEMMLMLRSLLADRFQVALHREKRQMAVDVLVVATGGPKFGPHFREAASGGQADPASGPPGQFPVPHVTMRDFALVLRANLLRALDAVTGEPTGAGEEQLPILDQTGLTGTYDISVTMESPMIWPAILERQLGLKLVRRTAPTEVFVIDRAVRPSAN